MLNIILCVRFFGTQMKKETKKLVGFEEALVNNYRHYLESLENIAAGCWMFYCAVSPHRTGATFVTS